ncbi:MAG: hypothetical protein MH204_05715 [Fimbriimonadaceae bacterium]|nr:hypothetical protein [Fimbriimonadaceae bacterium]
MKAAAAAWMIRPCRSETDFWSHFDEVVAEAKSAGADLLVLPEYFTLELDGRFDGPYEFPQERSDVLAERFLELTDSAREARLTLVCGSAFAVGRHCWVNRSVLVDPDGRSAWQDKLQMTQWESVEWGISSGEGLRQMPDPRIGISVCYDVEFPEPVAIQAEHGVDVLCVPSWTETRHGFHRVRTGCLARALENQIFTVHATLLGSLGREPVPSAVGSAAVISPLTPPFPETGVLAETVMDSEGLAVAELDLTALQLSRAQGDVRNRRDRATVQTAWHPWAAQD